MRDGASNNKWFRSRATVTDGHQHAQHHGRQEGVVVPGASSSWLAIEGLLVALNGVSDGQSWYVPARHLQLVCVDLCTACRRAFASRIVVEADTPRRLWLRRERERYESDNRGLRVPRMRVNVLVLKTSVECISHGSELFEWESADPAEGEEIETAWWPESVRQLTFRHKFNHSIDTVVWPASLQRLTLGWAFNQSVDDVEWPPSLLQITFGEHFNRPVNKVAWPASLQQLTFGRNFNQPCDEISWPPSLRRLAFGWRFDQPLDDIEWPASLQQLFFGRRFNQPIDDVVWPASLQKLSFGWNFDQPIGNAAWPESLRQVSFGRDFSRPVDGISWPERLQQVTVYGTFEHPIDTLKARGVHVVYTWSC
ncbi:unnamed protein product [Ascophyllum nodosum]